jgi:hypothetical protein
MRFRNKKKWEGSQKKTSQESASSQYPTPPPQERPVRTSTKPPRRKSASPQRVSPLRQYFYSFAKARKLPCPSKFRMRARAIDFFPLKLKECFVMQCDNPDCNEMYALARLVFVSLMLCPDFPMATWNAAKTRATPASSARQPSFISSFASSMSGVTRRMFWSPATRSVLSVVLGIKF